jgi:hypothetical protein
MPFAYPVPPAPRTAVLAPWFRPALLPSRMVKIFPRGWGEDAALFQPSAIAATLEQCRELRGFLIPSLTHALIVLARPAGERVSEAERNSLWRTFRVPVFEQIIGPSGQLLAGECEAHDGLHIEGPGLDLTPDRIDLSPCPCGRKTARFGVQPRARIERRAAAYAR